MSTEQGINYEHYWVWHRNQKEEKRIKEYLVLWIKTEKVQWPYLGKSQIPLLCVNYTKLEVWNWEMALKAGGDALSSMWNVLIKQSL